MGCCADPRLPTPQWRAMASQKGLVSAWCLVLVPDDIRMQCYVVFVLARCPLYKMELLSMVP